MSRAFKHEEAFELLPWFVNGTLAEAEHTGVAQHVRNCLPCRSAVQEQRRIASLIKKQPTVRLSAEPGFERLIHEIAPERVRPAGGPPKKWLQHLATAAGLVVGFGVAAWLVTLGQDPVRDAAFVTATSSPAPVFELDIVFAPEVSETELRALVRDIDGVMTGGPSAVGRYRVRFEGDERGPRDIDEVLGRLRSDERVRIAARAFTPEREP